MSAQNHATEIPIGDYDWLVLKEIGDEYFVCATSPLFKGYYSLEPCSFFESKLCKFLNSRFVEQMKESGVDISHIRNVGILSSGQYNMYMYDRVPNPSFPFLLQTPYPGEADCVTAVGKKGELIPVGITAQCGIRPSFFVSKEYVKKTTGISEVVSLADVKTFTEIEKEEAARLAIIKAAGEEEAEKDANIAQELISKEEDRLLEEERNSDKTSDDIDIIGNDDEIIIIEKGEEVGRLDILEEVSPDMRQEAPECPQAQVNKEPDELVKEDDNRTTEAQDAPHGDIADEGLTAKSLNEESEEPEQTETVNSSEEKDDDVENLLPDATIRMGSKGKDAEQVLVKDEGRGVHSVYWYGEDYKNYAILITDGDERVMSAMERKGLAIRAFLLSSNNEDRKPVDRTEVMNRFNAMQSRWSWQKKEKQKRK